MPDEVQVPWPFPGDSELEKRERVARDYRGALREENPDRCRELDEVAHMLGQNWITPEVSRFEEHDWITVNEAAELVRRTPRAVRYWTTADPPKVDSIEDARGVRRIRVGSLLDYERDLRERRAARPT